MSTVYIVYGDRDYEDNQRPLVGVASDISKVDKLLGMNPHYEVEEVELDHFDVGDLPEGPIQFFVWVNEADDGIRASVHKSGHLIDYNFKEDFEVKHYHRKQVIIKLWANGRYEAIELAKKKYEEIKNSPECLGGFQVLKERDIASQNSYIENYKKDIEATRIELSKATEDHVKAMHKQRIRRLEDSIDSCELNLKRITRED